MTSDFSVYAEIRKCVTIDTKGVIELLADIRAEVGGLRREVEHVPEVVLCRGRDCGIIAEVFAAHMSYSPEEAVKHGVLLGIGVAKGFRNDACVTVDEDHTSLVAVHIERDDVGAVLMCEYCGSVLLEVI